VGFGWVGIAPTEHRQLISMVISDQIPKLSAYEEVTIQTAFFSWRTRSAIWGGWHFEVLRYQIADMFVQSSYAKFITFSPIDLYCHVTNWAFRI